MISIILTAYREKNTIDKAIDSLVNQAYCGYKDKIELLHISPDKETLEAGKATADKLQKAGNNFDYKQIMDPGKGKPIALNLGLKAAKGDIVIFTDGDVHFGEKAIAKLVKKFSSNINIGAVTGRPISSDPKNKVMGYFGHLFADANHYRREIDLADVPLEKGKLFVKKHKFFPNPGVFPSST